MTTISARLIKLYSNYTPMLSFVRYFKKENIFRKNYIYYIYIIVYFILIIIGNVFECVCVSDPRSIKYS